MPTERFLLCSFGSISLSPLFYRSGASCPANAGNAPFPTFGFRYSRAVWIAFLRSLATSRKLYSSSNIAVSLARRKARVYSRSHVAIALRRSGSHEVAYCAPSTCFTLARANVTSYFVTHISGSFRAFVGGLIASRYWSRIIAFSCRSESPACCLSLENHAVIGCSGS